MLTLKFKPEPPIWNQSVVTSSMPWPNCGITGTINVTSNKNTKMTYFALHTLSFFSN
jgi:hypothetical protein